MRQNYIFNAPHRNKVLIEYFQLRLQKVKDSIFLSKMYEKKVESFMSRSHLWELMISKIL
ncbi:MAG TPA: hypothetical protein DCX03_02165 [Bacteroidales bacterium]|nr:hypothetical protein [Bacteroidales bacterium]